MKYSSGAFINIFTSDRDDWAHQFEPYRKFEGLGHVELLCEYELSASDVRFLDDLLGETNRTMHAPYVGVALASADAALRAAGVDRVTRFARIAEKLQCHVVTVHAGAVGAWETDEAAWTRLAQSIAELQGATTVAIGLENMPVRGGGSREPVARLRDMQSLADTHPHLTFTLDVGHVLQSGEDPAVYVNALHGRLVNVHLHDGIAGGRGHLALGEGNLDLEELLSSLDSSDYAGYVALETLGAEDTTLSWKTWRHVATRADIKLGPA